MIIKLTRLYKELTEEGHKKIHNMFEEGHIKRDEYDRSVDDYDRMGINPPKELLQDNLSTDNPVDLDSDIDFENKESNILCNMDKVIYMDEQKNGNTFIIFEGSTYNKGPMGIVYLVVKENINIINNLINN